MSGFSANIANYLTEHKSKEGGFGLIGLALILLCLSGFLSANFVSYGYSGLIPNSAVCYTTAFSEMNFSSPCSPAGPAYIVPDACNGATSYCQFHGVSILSPSTPLYYLVVQRNPMAFLTSIFTQQEQPSGYMIGETICVPYVNGALANATGGSIQNFRCYGEVSYTDQETPTVSIPLNASSAIGNNSIWTFSGCGIANCALNKDYTLNQTTGLFNYNSSNVAVNSLDAFYIKNGTSLTAGSSCSVFDETITGCDSILPRLFDTGSVTTFTCPNTRSLAGININKTSYYCLIPVITTNSGYAGSNTNSFGFLAFLTGVVFMIIGLGMYLSFTIIGSGSSIGSNPQGTKLAQHFGIGILVFGVLDLAFGSGIFMFDQIYSGK